MKISMCQNDIQTYRLIFKLTDEVIASAIRDQYIKMEMFSEIRKYDLAMQAKKNIRNYYDIFLMDRPEPFNPTLPGSSRISSSDSRNQASPYHQQLYRNHRH